MKLVNCELENQVVFEENIINCIVIEDKALFYNYINILFNQTNGNVLENGFILSHNGESLSLCKDTIMLINYFNINLGSNRTILNKFYNELAKEANDNYLEEFSKINSKILNLLLKLEVNFNANIVYSEELDIKKLFKIYDVNIELSGNSLLEKIIDYIEILIEFKICKLLIFVNLKNYLNEDNLLNLYQYVINKKFNILLIDNNYENKISNEKYLIIDKDFCEIVI
jgi:CRISPR type II-A-associated protein Csn2